MTEFSHLLTGCTGIIIKNLMDFNIEYTFIDLDISITEEDYSKYKNDLAKAGIL